MAALFLVLYASKEVVFLSFLYKFSLQIRCKMMGRFCLLIALLSMLEFCKRLRHAFAGFLDCVSILKLLLTKHIEFGSGFLTIWCFPKLLNVSVLFLVLFLMFKLFQFRGHCKWRRKRTSLRFSNGDRADKVKNFSLKSGVATTTRALGEEDGDQSFKEDFDDILSTKCGFEEDRCDHVDRDERVEEEEEECCDADHVFDLMSLRKMVKVQRRRANAAECELEKERMASASAADEAMAMILRLQSDKSSLQMQVNQLQRIAEERELHDEGVIESLEQIVMNQEYERSLMEEELRICREKLRLYMKHEEWDQFDDV